MIRFTCPTCSKRLKAPDDGAGRKTSCPRCGQRLLVPPPVQTQAKNKTVLGQTSPAIPEWLEEVSDAEGESLLASQKPPAHVLFECPTCHSPLNVAERMIGRMVECPNCRTQFAALKQNTVSSAPHGGVTAPDTFVPTHQNEIELVQPANRPRIRRNNEGGSMLLGILFTIGGGLLASVGFLMICYYWLLFDTSVPVYWGGVVPSPLGERVHNVGLQQDRLIGVIIGGGTFVVGLALYLIGLFVSPSRERNRLIFCTILLPILIVIMIILIGVVVGLFARNSPSPSGKRISLNLSPDRKMDRKMCQEPILRMKGGVISIPDTFFCPADERNRWRGTGIEGIRSRSEGDKQCLHELYQKHPGITPHAHSLR